jgi:hypothetical protein
LDTDNAKELSLVITEIINKKERSNFSFKINEDF